MLIEFTLTVEVEPLGKDDELSIEQQENLEKVLNTLEEVLGKNDLTLDDSNWEEV